MNPSPLPAALAAARERIFLASCERLHASGGDLNEFYRLRFFPRGPYIAEVTDPDMHLDISDLESARTRLAHAQEQGWISTVEWLINHGVDIMRAQPRCSETPLHFAALNGQRGIVSLLLDAGAPVNAITQNAQFTPLHYAADRGQSETCKLLLSRGAAIDARSKGSSWRRGTDAEGMARAARPTETTTADLLAAVREAGGWHAYVDAPRAELLALRRELPSLRERGRATPSSNVPLHERLFVKVPEDVFKHTIAFWRNDRDY